jgi:glutaredoxin 3
MAEVTIYSTAWCPFCVRAKRLLADKGAAFTEFDISGDAERRKEMIQRSGRTSVPQIWIGERHVGGCDELYALERQRQLDDLLAQ